MCVGWWGGGEGGGDSCLSTETMYLSCYFYRVLDLENNWVGSKLAVGLLAKYSKGKRRKLKYWRY